MRAEYINPFLQSATMVLEQMVRIRPNPGELSLKNVHFKNHYVWVQIGVKGQMNGDIIFGISESVALRIISAMMGGFVITEIDEIGKSAISELGNMISGNASTILSNQGVHIDISPPRVVELEHFDPRKALTIPLIMEGIGEMEIQVAIM